LKIRDTEGSPVEYREKIFANLSICDLQGLLMNDTWVPTAGVEAIDYYQGEIENIINDFGVKQLDCKLLFCEKLNIPLYIITSREKPTKNIEFSIYEVVRGKLDVQTKLKYLSFSSQQLYKWWKNLKQTEQTKRLYEAKSRILYKKSRVDYVIESRGLSWGGNIDGFLVKNSKISLLIECRQPDPLKNPIEKYDPKKYFFYRGGDYHTWLPLKVCAKRLNVPLLLLTFQKGKKIMGCAAVKNISRDKGIEYYKDDLLNGGPHQNLLSCDKFCKIARKKKWI
jgi:hypothetical protein